MVNDLPGQQEETAEVTKKMKITLSADLYERALRICQMRDCTLESVIEELIERFLPSTQPNLSKEERAKANRLHVEERRKDESRSPWIG